MPQVEMDVMPPVPTEAVTVDLIKLILRVTSKIFVDHQTLKVSLVGVEI
jgi:hypothetical protein